MSRLAIRAVLVGLAWTTGAAAEWRAATPAVTEAAREPRIAAALAAMNRIDAAILARDQAGFDAAFAPDTLVNNPQNKVAPPGVPGQRMAAGMIDYHSYVRAVEHVGVRPNGEVVAMGEEILRPRGLAPHAGKTVRRRFTDVWRNDGGTWRLALRQATIIAVE